ncbi:MAG: HAD family hydrolase [Propionibacteriaceae bacterium]|nr:HAD family hydrolase [Propionibacteriaceae bacterium]
MSIRLPQGIDTVFLDLDDTLFDYQTSSRLAVIDFAQMYAVEGDPTEILRRWYELEEEYFHQFELGHLSWRDQFFVRIALFLGIDESQEPALREAFQTFRDLYQSHWQAFSDAEPFIQRCLSADLRVGIITNGDPGMQVRKLRHIGISVDDDQVFASGSLGVAKPNPEIYRAACRAMGTCGNRAVMIGDNITRDYQGALDAGLHAILVQRDGCTVPHSIETLDDIIL